MQSLQNLEALNFGAITPVKPNKTTGNIASKERMVLFRGDEVLVYIEIEIEMIDGTLYSTDMKNRAIILQRCNRHRKGLKD